MFLAGALFLQAGISLAGGSGCLRCHESHYEETGSCTVCHRGNPGTDRISIAHHDLIPAKYAGFTLAFSPVVKRGRKTVETFGCRRCHVIGAKGNRLATDLDGVTVMDRPQRLFDAIETPAFFMPIFSFKESDITQIVNAILAEAAPSPKERGDGEIGVVVHFENNKQPEENVFVRHCGSCHQVLTTGFGGLGTGRIGPNLSGLLSNYYPKSCGEIEPWSSKKLKKWIENPRDVREDALMPPLRLTSAEFSCLLRLLAAQS